MSPHAMLETECPSCRAKQDIMIWQTLDVTGDPALKEQFFTGRINYFSYPACSFEGFITAPLAYTDRKNRVRARYVPVEYFEDKEFLRQSFTADGRCRTGRPGGDPEGSGPCDPEDIHIVFSMPELIRYVLFRDRLGQVFDGPEQEA